jgi:hypothetical protein
MAIVALKHRKEKEKRGNEGLVSLKNSLKRIEVKCLHPC